MVDTLEFRCDEGRSIKRKVLRSYTSIDLKISEWGNSYNFLIIKKDKPSELKHLSN